MAGLTSPLAWTPFMAWWNICWQVLRNRSNCSFSRLKALMTRIPERASTSRLIWVMLASRERPAARRIFLPKIAIGRRHKGRKTTASKVNFTLTSNSPINTQRIVIGCFTRSPKPSARARCTAAVSPLIWVRRSPIFDR